MTIDEIREKIIESRNNDIAKAFTMHIGSLLINNGIVPVITEYTGNDVKSITDTDEYKLVMEYGVAFKELDCSSHDKEVYNKAIDEFAELLKGNLVRKYANANLTQQYVALQVTDWCNEIAEQMKAGE